MTLGRLILYKAKIFLGNFTRGERRRRVVRIVTAVVIGVALVGFGVAAFGIFSALRLAGADAFALGGVIVTMTFHALLLLAFVFDISTTANIFFLSSDLPLLMAAPITTSKVFTLKYLEAWGSSSLMSSFVAFPILFGFGLAFGAPWPFYVAAFGIVALFLSIPVSIGTISGMIVSRFVPVSRVREALGLVGGVMALGFWITFQLLRPTISGDVRSGDVAARIQSLAAFGNNAFMKVLPSSIAARGLIDIAGRRAGSAFTPILYLVITAAVAFTVSVALAERMYTAGWVRVSPAGTRRTRRSMGLARLLTWLPPLERSMVTTAASLFFRDPQQVMPVATITIMMALFPFLVGRSQAEGFLNPGVVLQSFAALSFVGAMNMAISATMIDGRSFWLIMSAPRSAARKLLSKLLVPAVFFVPLAALAALGFRVAGFIGWDLAPKVIWFSACMTFVGGSVGVMLAMFYGNWQWEIPKQMLKTPGRLLMLGVMGAFFAAIGVILSEMSPNSGVRLLADARGPAFVLATGLMAALTYLFMGIAVKRMEGMEWKA
jgi:hypothetical protein